MTAYICGACRGSGLVQRERYYHCVMVARAERCSRCDGRGVIEVSERACADCRARVAMASLCTGDILSPTKMACGACDGREGATA